MQQKHLSKTEFFLFLSRFSLSLFLITRARRSRLQILLSDCRKGFEGVSIFRVFIKTSLDPVSKKKKKLEPLNTPSIGGSCAANAAQGGDPLPLARTRPSIRSPTERICLFEMRKEKKKERGVNFCFSIKVFRRRSLNPEKKTYHKARSRAWRCWPASPAARTTPSMPGRPAPAPSSGGRLWRSRCRPKK